jgi:hypothetical protein
MKLPVERCAGHFEGRPLFKTVIYETIFIRVTAKEYELMYGRRKKTRKKIGRRNKKTEEFDLGV